MKKCSNGRWELGLFLRMDWGELGKYILILIEGNCSQIGQNGIFNFNQKLIWVNKSKQKQISKLICRSKVFVSSSTASWSWNKASLIVEEIGSPIAAVPASFGREKHSGLRHHSIVDEGHPSESHSAYSALALAIHYEVGWWAEMNQWSTIPIWNCKFWIFYWINIFLGKNKTQYYY